MTEQIKSKKTGTWLRVVLGLSLALNLLVLGLVAGAALRFGGPDGRRSPPNTLGSALYHALPREDRRELRSHMQDHGPKHAERRKAEAKAIGDALRLTPFDPAAVREVLAEGASYREAWIASAHGAWLERIGKMSDAERLEFAERLQSSLARPDKRHGDGHRPKK